MSLNASIVLYRHTLMDIEQLIFSLKGSELVNDIFLIDNSPEENAAFRELPFRYIFNGKNLGYGTAHNIAIRHTIEQKTPYHLVLNPDILLKNGVLEKLVTFLNDHPDVGQVMPKVLYPNGRIQHLAKLLPKPSDLLFRRFLPEKWTKKSNDIFELRHSGYNKIMDVPYLSGCFMMLRTQALEDVGLFDERFFMYPEDIDLTRRIHRKYRTVYYPDASIIHYHEQASYKSGKLLFVHIWNLIKYFNKWGWFFDAERKKINAETLKKINLL